MRERAGRRLLSDLSLGVLAGSLVSLLALAPVWLAYRLGQGWRAAVR
jgi:hypothetical protein